MLKTFRVDLHIHTCLSPCADIDMTPKRIVQRARQEGLDIIAVSDHNSVENFPALAELAEGLTVLPAMEVTTSEEVHLLAVMPDYEAALTLQGRIYSYLPIEKNSRLHFEQLVVNAEGQLVHFNERSLIEPVDMTVEETVQFIHSLGGIAIASHIDRELYGIINALGKVPEDVDFDALEISFRTSPEEARKRFENYRHLPWLWSSDAHHIDQIGRAFSSFLIERPSFDEIKMAIKGLGGRKVLP